MASKKPDYEDWKRSPDLSGETPDSAEGHRILVWLWIIGIVVFGLIVWGIAELTSNLRPGPHGGLLFGH
ncbi:MAG: hypothetical protein JO250_21400 [Armatimonadetes bacterium]|nr:hypothetical protein [Armatimonadota bacterium]